MKTYSFKDIVNVYVLGDCHGEFKDYFHGIKNGLDIKSEDEDKPHPKELERQARKAAREQAMRNAGRPQIAVDAQGRRYMRFAEPPRDNHGGDNGWATLSTATISDTLRKMKKGKMAIYANSLFIIAGDCGLGFNKPKYYEDLFDKFNKVLSYNNSYIIMVRGNHDDPAYFDGERVNLSNIKAVPDYSVISAGGKNILCVGGAISLDRTWRIKQEQRINRFSTTKKKTIYWKDEAPVYNQEALDDITKNIKIDYVVSHTAPSFVSPENHAGLDDWSVDDSTLVSDVKEERRVLDKVFETLRDCDMRPKYWAYGHFDYCFIEKRSDTLFRGLGDGFNPLSIDMDIAQFFQNEEMRKKKKKKASSIKTISANHLLGDELVDEAPAHNEGAEFRPVQGGIFRNDPMMWEEHRDEGNVEAEENEAVMEEALPEAPEEARDEAEDDDRAFNELLNIGNGEVAEDAPRQNAVDELPNNAEGTALGGAAMTLDELQRRALYERARRELEEATARFRTVNADRYYGNYANVLVDYPGAFTVATDRTANGVADNNNGVAVGTINH